ncbi:hypothetical protein [Brevibacillus porteri]|uniref:hypothetical protein n=1 Tax=Brevibacillus porteri TaxID=2126350 RepID=UPI003D240DDD
MKKAIPWSLQDPGTALFICYPQTSLFQLCRHTAHFRRQLVEIDVHLKSGKQTCKVLVDLVDDAIALTSSYMRFSSSSRFVTLPSCSKKPLVFLNKEIASSSSAKESVYTCRLLIR